MKIKTEKAIILLVLLFFSNQTKSEEITIADVVAAQEENAGNIQTMAAEVENEVDYGGNKQTLTYEYMLQNNPDGSKKMMVVSKGIFTMQFLVDTKEGSVTYLMADGSTKKFTLTREELEKINAQFSFNNLQPTMNNIQYAALNNSAKDGKYITSLNTDIVDTGDGIIKVDRKRSSKEHVYVEFYDKKAKEVKKQIEEKIAEMERMPATKKEGKKMKEKIIAQMKKNKDKVIKTTIARRVEKINRKNGIVEETEFYNNDNEKIGFVRMKKSSKFKVQGSKNKEKMLKEQNNETGEKTKDIEMPTEVETEMETISGKSKIKTRMRNIKVNEPVEFRWKEIKTKN